MGIRRKSRECVLQMLYQMDFGGGGSDDVIMSYWRTNDASDDIRIFANELLVGISKNLDSIDSKIAENSTNWKLSRMASVDKNILRLAVYELLHRDDIPAKVTINEAVEIAKKFGTAESGAFVNGVLDNIAKDIVPSEEIAGGSSDEA